MEVIEGALASNEKYETILFPIGEKCGLDKKNEHKKEMEIDIESQLSPECGSLKHCRSNPGNELTVWETHREFPKHFVFGEDKNNFRKNYIHGLKTNTEIIYCVFSQLFLQCGWIEVVKSFLLDKGCCSAAHAETSWNIFVSSPVVTTPERIALYLWYTAVFPGDTTTMLFVQSWAFQITLLKKFSICSKTFLS